MSDENNDLKFDSDLSLDLEITVDPLQHAKNLIGMAVTKYEETIATLESERNDLIEKHTRNMEHYAEQISKNKHALAGLQMSIEIYKRPTEEVVNGKPARKEIYMESGRHSRTSGNKVPKAKPVARTPRSQQVPDEVSSISAKTR